MVTIESKHLRIEIIPNKHMVFINRKAEIATVIKWKSLRNPKAAMRYYKILTLLCEIVENRFDGFFRKNLTEGAKKHLFYDSIFVKFKEIRNITCEIVKIYKIEYRNKN